MKTKLNPSPLFTDGAVLCRGKEIRLFGEAEDGVTVKAVLVDAGGRILGENEAVGKGGKFLICLPPQEIQTGCRLMFSDGTDEATATDVAIGEVYLAGGQSNMELELRNAAEGPAIIPTLNDPGIRFFNVPRKACENEEQREALAQTRWHAADPETGGYNSAVAYFFARKMREKHPETPLGIIGCYWGGTSVTCWMDEETLRSLSEGIRYLEEYAERSGEKTMAEYLKEEEVHNRLMDEWNGRVERYKAEHPGAPWKDIEDAAGICPWNPPAGPGSPYRPAGLAGSMLRHVSPCTLTGILYYQGEDDAGRTDHYDTLMIAMIRYWRKLFREAELPFLFVQLPMWIDVDAPDSFRWPLTRLAQAAVRDTVRNTGMISQLDQGEYGNIHPVHKQPVGERLAELLLAMRGEDGKVSPRAVGKYTAGNTMTVQLSAPVFPADGKVPALMEIAGEDGQFVPARAVISEDTLRLWAPEMEHPVQARYAWADYSDRVNLFGENGLPLEPFWLR